MVIVYSSISGPFNYLIGETKNEVTILTNCYPYETIVISPLLSANKFIFVLEESDLKFDYKRNEIIGELTSVISLEFERSHCLKMDIYKLGKLRQHGDLKRLRAKNEQHRVDFVRNSETDSAIRKTQQFASCLRNRDGSVSIFLKSEDGFKQSSPSESEKITNPPKTLLSFSTRLPFSYSTNFDGSNIDLKVTSQNVCSRTLRLNSDVIEKIKSQRSPPNTSSEPSPSTTKDESSKFVESLNVQQVKVEPNLPSSSQPTNFTNQIISNPLSFIECAKCHCSLDGLQKELGQKKRVANVLSCGHVVCNFCVNRVPPNSTPFVAPIVRNSCPICLKAQRRFELPKTHQTGAYCSFHSKKEAKFYCEECMRYLCSEKDCKEHPAIRIEEISMKISGLDRKLASASLYIQEMTTMEEKSKKCLPYLDEKSSKLEKTFNLLIDSVVRRYHEIQMAIQAEKVEVSKNIEQISKDLEGAKRRVQVAYNVHETVSDTSSFLDQFAVEAYQLAAGNILEKGLEISEYLKTSPKNMHCYKLEFEGESCMENVAKDLRTLFPEYIVSNGEDCEVYEIPSYTEFKLRKNCPNYLKGILSHNDEKSDKIKPIPPRRKKVLKENKNQAATDNSADTVPVQKHIKEWVMMSQPNEHVPESMTVEEIFEKEKRHQMIMNIVKKNSDSHNVSSHDLESSSSKSGNDTKTDKNRKRIPSDIPDSYKVLESEVKRKRSGVTTHNTSHLTNTNQRITFMEQSDEMPGAKEVHELREEEKTSLIDTETDMKQEMIVDEMPTTSNGEDYESHEGIDETSDNNRPQFYSSYRKRGTISISGQFQALGRRKIVVDKNYTANYASVQSAFQNTTFKKEPFTSLTPESRYIVLQRVDELCEEEQNRRKGTKIDYLKEKVIIAQQSEAIQDLVDELYEKQQMDELLNQVVKQEDIAIDPLEIQERIIKQEVLRIDQTGIMDKEIKEEERE